MTRTVISNSSFYITWHFSSSPKHPHVSLEWWKKTNDKSQTYLGNLNVYGVNEGGHGADNGDAALYFQKMQPRPVSPPERGQHQHGDQTLQQTAAAAQHHHEIRLIVFRRRDLATQEGGERANKKKQSVFGQWSFDRAVRGRLFVFMLFERRGNIDACETQRAGAFDWHWIIFLFRLVVREHQVCPGCFGEKMPFRILRVASIKHAVTGFFFNIFVLVGVLDIFILYWFLPLRLFWLAYRFPILAPLVLTAVHNEWYVYSYGTGLYNYWK